MTKTATYILPECNDCQITYDDDGSRHVRTFHRMTRYAENDTPDSFREKRNVSVLTIAEHRISNHPDLEDESRLVFVSCDGVRFIIEVKFVGSQYIDFGTLSTFNVEDAGHMERLVKSLVESQEEFWSRVRKASVKKEGKSDAGSWQD